MAHGVDKNRLDLWRSLLQKSRLLVFDFDGTLVDSVQLKWSAFDRCFEQFPDQMARIRAYCRGNNHTPRWEKFQHVYENILQLPYSDSVEKDLLRKFEQETTDRIAQAPEFPGVSEFLEQVSGSRRIALLSSTPHDVLLQILKKRGWQNRFHLVQGAPVNKAQWLKALCAQGYTQSEVLFWGDTPEDAAAAKEAGCGFIFAPELGDFRKLADVRC